MQSDESMAYWQKGSIKSPEVWSSPSTNRLWDVGGNYFPFWGSIFSSVKWWNWPCSLRPHSILACWGYKPIKNLKWLKQEKEADGILDSRALARMSFDYFLRVMSQEVEKEKQLCLGKYNSIKKKIKNLRRPRKVTKENNR